jgi:MFS family permease
VSRRRRSVSKQTGPTLRSLGLAVFLPSLLFGIGQGAILPVVALSARDLGASVAQASLVVALAGLGQFLGDVPAGTLTSRAGERRAMLLAAGMSAGALLACVVARTVWALGAAILCTGLAAAIWGLARQAYLTETMPLNMRARAMSTLGGTQRIGMFVGPFLTAAGLRRWDTDCAYWIHLAAVALAAGLVYGLPDVTRAGGHALDRSATRLSAVVRTNVGVLRTTGAASMLVGAVRASRQAVIPLWAEHIGLDPSTASVIFGVSGALDMLLFYPAGKVMDVRGRVVVAVPSMLIMGVALLLIPLTSSAVGLGALAALMGVGNGMSSGLLMTLGADASPNAGRAQFLGVWRMCIDFGSSGGPLAVSAVAASAGLGPAVLAAGSAALVGAAALHRWVPRQQDAPVSRPA